MMLAAMALLRLTMAKMRIWICATVLVLLFGTGRLVAAPLQTAHVPADVAWVLHFDWRGLRPLALGQFISNELNKPDSRPQLVAFEKTFDLDVRKQISGITLYSTGKRPEEAALLAYGEFDPAHLSAQAKRIPEYQGSKHGKYVIHSWVNEDKHGKKDAKHRVYAAFHPRHIMIFGERAATVATALDVIDRTAPNLSANALFTRVGVAGDSNLIEGAARKMDISSSDPGSAVFRLAKMVRLRVSESDRQITATVNMDVDDEDVSRNIAVVARGLISLLALNSDKSGWSKMADAISFKRDGIGVSAILMMPADEVVTILKTASDKKAKKDSEQY
jgi:hypothetical protein